MKDWMHHLDPVVAEQLAHQGVDTARAYAASVYIAQQCGEGILLDGKTVEQLPAYLIGNTSASVIENSTLMALYSKGAIGMKELYSRISRLYHAVSGYALQWMLIGSAFILQGLNAFNFWVVFIHILKFMAHAHPLLWMITSITLAGYMGFSVNTTQDYENFIMGVIHLVKAVFNFCKMKIEQALNSKDSVQAENETVADVAPAVVEESVEEDEDEEEQEEEDNEDEEV